MPGYKYDIFISHRRSHEDHVRWTRECFLRPLTASISRYINEPVIFIDEQIENGAEWPAALAEAHATARILVPILQPTYFDSDWCRLEMALMKEREAFVAREAGGHPPCLVYPVTINDGDDFPADIRSLQQLPLHEHSCPYLLPFTEPYVPLAKEVDKWAQGLKSILRDPPPWNPAWADIARERFRDAYRVSARIQATVPVHSGLLIPP